MPVNELAPALSAEELAERFADIAPPLGVDAARNRSEELLGTALGELEELGERAEPLRELVRFSVRRCV